MKHLSIAIAGFCLFFVVNSCRPDTKKVISAEHTAKVLAVLDSLTENESITDNFNLHLIDSLLAEIQTWQVDRIDSVIAEICHEKLGTPLIMEYPVLARQYYQQALDIRKRIYANDTAHIDILRLYHNLGVTYSNEDEDEKALHYFDAADVHTPEYLQRIYFNNMLRRGIVLNKLGEPARALDDLHNAYQYLHHSLSLLYYSGNAVLIPDVLSEYAACYRVLNRYKEGLEKAYEGNQIVNKMVPDADTMSIKVHLNAIADLKIVTGNLWQDSMVVAKSAVERAMAFDSAVTYILDANLIYDRTQNQEHKLDGASNLGALYTRAEQLNAAYSVLSDEIGFCEKNELELRSAPLYINRGYVLQKQKRFAWAFENYHQALIAMGGIQWNNTTGFPALSTLQGNHSNIFNLLINIATAWMDSARLVPNDPQVLAKAATACDSLQAFAELMRNSLMSDGAKLTLAKDARIWVGQAVESNLQLYRLKKEESEGTRYLEQAFRTAEQGKAFALLDAARLRNASSSLPASIQKEEGEILMELSFAKDDPKLKASAERRKRKFLAKLEREQPQFFNLKYQNSSISTETIRRKLLAPDQAMLEYSCNDSVLYCFLITPDIVSVDSVQISKKALSDLVSKFQNLMELDNANTAQQQAFIQASHQLYQVLLAKLAPQLERYPRLIIIPDAPFTNLSFDGLLFKTSIGDVTKQVDDENFMVFKYAISYCFSANLLWEMQRHQVPDKLARKVAVFVPDVARKLEVEHLAASGLGEILTNSKAAFWDACSRFAFAHVAGHGKVDHHNPGLSHIKFSDSSLLYLNDLYNHRIDLEMVALSACETTKGQYSEGEGNLSLARGLAYAGVRSFISTQWEIPTDGPAKIMPPFYDGLFLNNMPKDVAFATAKRTFLRGEGFRGPKNWAGMVFIGACGMAAPEPPTTGCFAWVALLVAMLAGGWLVYRKRPIV